ncbi:hypothetical protein PRZ48_000846 [Zasmidium cellare]|uniref:Uncharacterized protein n=1 Tax=Zasmidium cellare TaxID=395010 RepID=A0ABR0F054_ZASCE|nr:hypothetical protein PRZ48_000846 [Zasmidium cellare]
MSELKKGLAFSRFDATFRDAMVTTQNLDKDLEPGRLTNPDPETRPKVYEDIYGKAINMYSTCRLSFPHKDKLAAFEDRSLEYADLNFSMLRVATSSLEQRRDLTTQVRGLDYSTDMRHDESEDLIQTCFDDEAQFAEKPASLQLYLLPIWGELRREPSPVPPADLVAPARPPAIPSSTCSAPNSMYVMDKYRGQPKPNGSLEKTSKTKASLA